MTASRTASAYRVLVVDDHELIRRTAKVLLESHGHKVTAARDGAEALASEDTFDVALVDAGLRQGTGGADLAAALKAARPGLRVVLMSGDPAKLEGHPCDAALPKPFGSRQLLDALAKALGTGG